jgi:hypothetical protein
MAFALSTGKAASVAGARKATRVSVALCIALSLLSPRPRAPPPAALNRVPVC